MRSLWFDKSVTCGHERIACRRGGGREREEAPPILLHSVHVEQFSRFVSQSRIDITGRKPFGRAFCAAQTIGAWEVGIACTHTYTLLQDMAPNSRIKRFFYSFLAFLLLHCMHSHHLSSLPVSLPSFYMDRLFSFLFHSYFSFGVFFFLCVCVCIIPRKFVSCFTAFCQHADCHD